MEADRLDRLSAAGDDASSDLVRDLCDRAARCGRRSAVDRLLFAVEGIAVAACRRLR